MRSIRKKSDNLFRKGRRGATESTGHPDPVEDPNNNAFEGQQARLTIAKNPLQHSMAVAAEDAKKREAATAGFKDTSKGGSSELAGEGSNNFKSKAVHRINQHLERIRDEFGDRRAAALEEAKFKPRLASPNESEKDRVAPSKKLTKSPVKAEQ